MGRLSRKAQYDYFDYFARCTGYASQAASYLHAALLKYKPESIEAQVEEMHEIENSADVQKHEMLEHLAHEFITPIEREDIVALAQQLDDVVDAIDDVMGRLYMFNIRMLRPDAVAFTKLIIACCTALTTVAEEFRNFKRSKTLLGHIIAVSTIESEGDRLYAECMHRLFTDKTSTRDMLAWSTLYEGLENCLDACEDTVDIIESVIMKNT